MSLAVQKPPSRSRGLTEPRIVEMPPERMAVVETVGDPNVVGKQAIPALYSAVFALKFAEKKQGRDFKLKPLRARWVTVQGPDGPQLRGIWGLPVPPLTRALTQRAPGTTVELKTWGYGTMAEILHLGAYSAEAPSIERLLTFVREQGYDVDGPHEEEYLSRPEAAVPKTLIRYPIKKLSRKPLQAVRHGGEPR